MFGNGKPFKNTPAVFSYAEEVRHHTHHERFPESAWPGEESDFVIGIIHKFVNQFLIHNVWDGLIRCSAARE